MEVDISFFSIFFFFGNFGDLDEIGFGKIWVRLYEVRVRKMEFGGWDGVGFDWSRIDIGYCCFLFLWIRRVGVLGWLGWFG